MSLQSETEIENEGSTSIATQQYILMILLTTYYILIPSLMFFLLRIQRLRVSRSDLDNEIQKAPLHLMSDSMY